MPKILKLSWQPGAGNREGRWRKVYRGKAYHFPGGKGKSDREAYDAAWAAWELLKTKIDAAAPRRHQQEYEAAIDRWERVLAWCGRHGEPQLAETAYQKLRVLRKMLAAPVLAPLAKSETFEATYEVPSVDLDAILRDGTTPIDASQMKLAAPLDLSPQALARHVAAIDGSPTRISQEIWDDRLEVEARKPSAENESLHAQIQKYLSQKEGQADAGQVSAGRVYALKLHLGHFEDWLGKDTAVRDIDGEVLADYHTHILAKMTSKEWTRTTGNHYLTTVKSFVRWLWQVEAIESLPRLLDGRSNVLTISKPTAKVVVFTKDEIKVLLGAAAPRTKLYILLMLNCGMTQKDVSDLLVSEVDWDEGTITRKRSKTADVENVPLVCYKLWPETFRLLKQERAAESRDRVLLNVNGGPLWSEEITKDGKYKKTDNVKNAFDRLRKVKEDGKPSKSLKKVLARKTKTSLKASIEKPLKSLKKTSATLLRGNEKYSGLAGLFLGHAPQGMADRHYTQVPQGLLDQAVAWLGQEFGLIERPEQPKATTRGADKQPSEIQDGNQADSESLGQGTGGETNQSTGVPASLSKRRRKAGTGEKPGRQRRGKSSSPVGS